MLVFKGVSSLKEVTFSKYYIHRGTTRLFPKASFSRCQPPNWWAAVPGAGTERAAGQSTQKEHLSAQDSQVQRKGF